MCKQAQSQSPCCPVTSRLSINLSHNNLLPVHGLTSWGALRRAGRDLGARIGGLANTAACAASWCLVRQAPARCAGAVPIHWLCLLCVKWDPARGALGWRQQEALW